MSSPVGNTAIVTRNNAILRALQEQAHQAAHIQSAPVKDALKTQVAACIEKCLSTNDQSKAKLNSIRKKTLQIINSLKFSHIFC